MSDVNVICGPELREMPEMCAIYFISVFVKIRVQVTRQNEIINYQVKSYEI